MVEASSKDLHSSNNVTHGQSETFSPKPLHSGTPTQRAHILFKDEGDIKLNHQNVSLPQRSVMQRATLQDLRKKRPSDKHKRVRQPDHLTMGRQTITNTSSSTTSEQQVSNDSGTSSAGISSDDYTAPASSPTHSKQESKTVETPKKAAQIQSSRQIQESIAEEASSFYTSGQRRSDHGS